MDTIAGKCGRRAPGLDNTRRGSNQDYMNEESREPWQIRRYSAHLSRERVRPGRDNALQQRSDRGSPHEGASWGYAKLFSLEGKRAPSEIVLSRKLEIVLREAYLHISCLSIRPWRSERRKVVTGRGRRQNDRHQRDSPLRHLKKMTAVIRMYAR